MDSFLLVLLSIVFMTIILNTIMKKFELPTILGYIITGIILMRFYKVGFNDLEILSNISEFGIVFLMFTIGLEFSVKYLRSNLTHYNGQSSL